MKDEAQKEVAPKEENAAEAPKVESATSEKTEATETPKTETPANTETPVNRSEFTPSTVAVDATNDLKALDSLSQQLEATAKTIETIRIGLDQQQKSTVAS